MTALYKTRLAAAPVTEPTVPTVRKENMLKNIALFVAGPFVALAYVITFPLVGLGLLAWFGARAALKCTVVRTIATAIAAPFIALACVVLFPFVGLAALIWIAGRAWLATAEPPEHELRPYAAAA